MHRPPRLAGKTGRVRPIALKASFKYVFQKNASASFVLNLFNFSEMHYPIFYTPILHKNRRQNVSDFGASQDALPPSFSLAVQKKCFASCQPGRGTAPLENRYRPFFKSSSHNNAVRRPGPQRNPSLFLPQKRGSSHRPKHKGKPRLGASPSLFVTRPPAPVPGACAGPGTPPENTRKIS